MTSDESLSFKALSEVAAWTEGANAWALGTISLAVNVIDELARGIATFPDVVDDRFRRKAMAVPVGIGCVPWLNDDAVIDALLGLDQVCIVIDKKASQTGAKRLLDEACGLWQPLIGLEEFGVPNATGEPPWITPEVGGMPGERRLDPVRVVGWRKQKGRTLPLLHAKLLVLGAAYEAEWDYGTVQLLRPLRVWVGSPNWTAASRDHLEVGVWCDDPGMAKQALRFLTSIVRISERLDATALEPSPELVEGRWDDEAFADLAAEYHEYQAGEEG